MAAHEAGRCFGMSKGVFHAAAQYALDRPGQSLVQSTRNDDGSERQRQRSAFLPLLSQIGYEPQSLPAVRESAFVDQYAGVAFVAQNGVGDIGEQVNPFVGRFGEKQRQQPVCGRVLARDRDAGVAQFVRVELVPADQQWPVAPTERASAAEYPVVVRDEGEARVAQFRYVGLSGERRGVELLDVGHGQIEVESFGVDPPVKHRVEHERVVRTGRYAQFEFHAFRLLRFYALCLRLVSGRCRAVCGFRRSAGGDTVRP